MKKKVTSAIFLTLIALAVFMGIKILSQSATVGKTVTITKNSGDIKIVDANGDGVPDYSMTQAPYDPVQGGSAAIEHTPTAEEVQYFKAKTHRK